MADNEPTYKAHQDHVRRSGIERQNVIQITEDETGSQIILLICPDCHMIETHCLHVSNSWNEDGTQLTCNLCGIDGT